eukprot:m.322615 g.322615  ORF g.322615 m.322615 type:complete len:277 (+) comp27260_c0_seq1:47-877(+)
MDVEVERPALPPLHHFDYGEEDIESGWEKELDAAAPPKFCSALGADHKFSGKTLLVAFGAVPVAVVQGCCQLPRSVWEQRDHYIHTASAGVRKPQREAQHVRAYLSAATEEQGGLVVCLCPHAVPAQDANAWAAELLGHVQVETVVMLCEMGLYQYRRDDASSSDPLVRSLVAGGFALAADSGLPPLPCPNVLDGAPAAVLTACQLRHLPAAASIVYRVHANSVRDLDLASLQAHTPALALPQLAALVKSPEECHQAMKAFVAKTQSQPLESLLYM